MKKSVKTSLIIIALALVAGLAFLVWLGSRRDDAAAESVLDSSQGPAFEVRVIVPRVSRPFAGILPDWVVAKFDGTPGVLRFDHTSRGAHVGSVGHNRVELKADDWDFFIETDAEGRITPGTRLVFPLALGGRHVKLNCRPQIADRLSQHHHARRLRSVRGRFLVELANCKNAESGKEIEWPAAPLTVRGSFVGPAKRPSLEDKGSRPKGDS